jgi:hypothetical protein
MLALNTLPMNLFPIFEREMGEREQVQQDRVGVMEGVGCWG